ncbi:MAG: hypothetical protein QNJ46_32370 [Leptolyngbyaceae cyanobacterium MO_188.B28]|nr:hypothetical protein [Leptolyngbyaceae cyanobacterium MO_188.B28]
MGNDIRVEPLIELLQAALDHPVEKERLLQQTAKLREIINHIPARRWLFEQWRLVDQGRQPLEINRVMDLIVAMMKSSGLLWRGGRISPDVYSEALSQTWEWFITGFETYDPEQASFVTWFNGKLVWKIQDVIRAIAQEEKTRLRPLSNAEEDAWLDPPAPDPDRWRETVQHWRSLLHQNPHRCANCRMQQYPHVNCEKLLLQILNVLEESEAFSWDPMAQRFGVEPL